MRVVDYKTGQKRLNLRGGLLRTGLPDAAVSVPALRGTPAAVLPGGGRQACCICWQTRPENTTRAKAAQPVEYSLDGLVRDEQRVFDAMDADRTGRYLPFRYRGCPQSVPER